MSDFQLYLAYTAAFTALMWVPYVLNMIIVRGLFDAVGYPDNPKPLAPWAQRMRNAHYNAVENLVVMATLALLTPANMVTQTMTTAMLVYLILRIVHFFAYTFRVPWVRTLTFVGAWACVVVVAVRILL